MEEEVEEKEAREDGRVWDAGGGSERLNTGS